MEGLEGGVGWGGCRTAVAGPSMEGLWRAGGASGLGGVPYSGCGVNPSRPSMEGLEGGVGWGCGTAVGGLMCNVSRPSWLGRQSLQAFH